MQLISNIDLAPTLCDLAGIGVPSLMDGRSLAPLLKGNASGLGRPWRTHFMIEFAEGGALVCPRPHMSCAMSSANGLPDVGGSRIY